MLRISKAGVACAAGEAKIAAWRRSFERGHFVRFPGFLEPDLLAYIQGLVDKTPFFKRDHEGGGFEHCMKEDSAARDLLLLWLNDEALFRIVRRITGRPGIKFFMGRVYRHVPGEPFYDDWHDDMVGPRLAALTVNLSRKAYSGGSLVIRRKGEERFAEVPNAGFGDAVLFKISRDLQHGLTELQGSAAKTAFAGWFQSEGSFSLRRRA